MTNYPLRSILLQTSLALLLCFIAGCATTPIGTGFDLQGNPVYVQPQAAALSDIDDFRERSFLDPASDGFQINFLIQRIETSPLMFVRNGQQADGRDTARFIRWKMKRPRWKEIYSADDFVNILMHGSVMSGQPYFVIREDGSLQNLQFVLQNELDNVRKLISS